jgi:hypothetical protein
MEKPDSGFYKEALARMFIAGLIFLIIFMYLLSRYSSRGCGFVESCVKPRFRTGKRCAWNRYCPVKKKAFLWKVFYSGDFHRNSSTGHVDNRKTSDNEWD